MRVGGRSWRELVPPWGQRLLGREGGLWERVAGGALWSIGGTGIMNALTTASSVVCARLLGSTRFGELAILLSTVNFFLVIGSAGLGMTASRYVGGQRNADPVRAGRIIGLCSATALAVGLGIATLCVLFAPWLSTAVLRAPGLARGVALAGGILLFSTINASQVGILGGLEDFRSIAIGNVIRGVGVALLASAGAALLGLNGALLGYLIAGLATTVYYRISFHRECKSRSTPVTYRFEAQDFRILYTFTLPVLVATLSHVPAVWWTTVLLARTKGYSEAGIYNAIMQCQVLILFITTATSNISLPTLSNVLSEGDERTYKRCLRANFLVTTVPAVIVAILVAIFSRFIMGLYGPAFQVASNAVILICISAIFLAISTPMNLAMWSLEAAVPAIALSLVRGGVLVIAAYALVGKGAEGLVWANVIMAVLQAAIGLPWLAVLIRRRFHSGLAIAPQESWAVK
jgi:O-antigen/teichoic acid export membrane protein